MVEGTRITGFEESWEEQPILLRRCGPIIIKHTGGQHEEVNLGCCFFCLLAVASSPSPHLKPRSLPHQRLKPLSPPHQHPKPLSLPPQHLKALSLKPLSLKLSPPHQHLKPNQHLSLRHQHLRALRR